MHLPEGYELIAGSRTDSIYLYYEFYFSSIDRKFARPSDFYQRAFEDC